MNKVKTELKIYTHDLKAQNLLRELRQCLLMAAKSSAQWEDIVVTEELVDKFLDQDTGGFLLSHSQFGIWIYIEGSLFKEDGIECQQHFHSRLIAFLAKTLYPYEWYAIPHDEGKFIGLAWYRALPYSGVMGDSNRTERYYINYNIDFHDFGELDWDYLHISGS